MRRGLLRHTAFAFLVGLVGPSTLCAARPWEKAPALQGVWQKVSGKMVWNPAWGNQRGGVTFEFREEKAIFSTEKVDQTSRISVVDVSREPNRLCLVARVEEGGRTRLYTLKCLFEVRGDTLKLCWVNAGISTDYPASFDDANVNGSIVLERKKPK